MRGSTKPQTASLVASCRGNFVVAYCTAVGAATDHGTGRSLSSCDGCSRQQAQELAERGRQRWPPTGQCRQKPASGHTFGTGAACMINRMPPSIQESELHWIWFALYVRVKSNPYSLNKGSRITCQQRVYLQPCFVLLLRLSLISIFGRSRRAGACRLPAII